MDIRLLISVICALYFAGHIDGTVCHFSPAEDVANIQEVSAIGIVNPSLSENSSSHSSVQTLKRGGHKHGYMHSIVYAGIFRRQGEPDGNVCISSNVLSVHSREFISLCRLMI